jgi:DNA transformation protein
MRRLGRTKTSTVFPGIGPVTEKRLIEVGVADLGALRQIGALDTYRRLKFRFGKDVTLNALYGLEAVILGCHWLQLPPERKDALKRAAEAVPTGPTEGPRPPRAG